MTEITVRRDGRWATVKAEGHATGSVAACAAVSTIFYGLAGYLQNSCIKVRTQVLQPGDAQITFSLLTAEAKHLFKLAHIALAQLAESEPDYVLFRDLSEKK